MEKSWVYFDRKGNAGLTSRPPRFKDLGEHSIGIFIRELIQNSLDAKLKNENSVVLKFKVEEWDESDIRSFFDIIGEEYINKFKQSYEYAITDVKPKMTNGINLIRGEKKSSFALTIEEYNCIGLTGSVKGIDRRSNFNSLIRKVDDNEAKKELSNSGGTWGKGSSIFVYSSELWMWYCYSLLSTPNDEDDGQMQYRRFIGRSILSPYYSKTTDTSYFGDSWYCKPNTDSFPYINQEADSYAESFGLEKRSTQVGSTFFIPFFNTFLEKPDLKDVIKEFHDQILINWYIPIYNEELIIYLTDKKGHEFKIDKTYLSKIEQLKFKLEILNWYNHGCPPDDKFIKETYDLEIPALKKDYVGKNNAFAAEKQKVKMDLLIRVISEDEDFNNDWETCNKVALTRNKGMLIADHNPFELTSIRTESIFFGGLQSLSEPNVNKQKHSDLFLAYSENPAHNKWCTKSQDYNSCFLEFFDGKRPAPESLINKIFDEIFKSFKKLFDQEIQPETSKDICSIFKKIAKLKISGGVGGGQSLFSMRTPANVTNPIIDSSGRYIYSYIIISTVRDKLIDVSFHTTLNSLEGEISTDFSVLGIEEFKRLELSDESGFSDVGDAPALSLRPGEEKTIELKTCKIQGNKIFKNLEPIIKAVAKLQ